MFYNKYGRLLLKFICLFLFFIHPIELHSADDSKKLLILPFENLSDTNQFPLSVAMEDVIFKSLYNFLGIIPRLEVPEENELTNMELRQDLQKTARKMDAKYIVLGDYYFEDRDGVEEIILNLRIWSYVKDDYLFEKSFYTTPGLDFFDTLDLLIENVIQQVLDIEMEIAMIRFRDFSIGSEEHSIYINRKKLTKVTNDGYSETIRVLADQDYLIRIRNSSWNLVYETNWTPEPGGVLDINYNGMCTIVIDEIEFRKPTENYFLTLNDELIIEDIILSNMLSGKNYTFSMFKNQSNQYKLQTEYLKSGDKITFEPKETNTLIHQFYGYMMINGGILNISSENTNGFIDTDDDWRWGFIIGVGLYLDISSYLELDFGLLEKDKAFTTNDYSDDYYVNLSYLPRIGYGRHIFGNHFKPFLMSWKASIGFIKLANTQVEPDIIRWGLETTLSLEFDMQINRNLWLTFRPNLSIYPIIFNNVDDYTQMTIDHPVSINFQAGIRANLF